ncbi:glycoside hydrolase family 35 protein [Flavobacterium daemonense]|uniref:glycoside hydrolase family 35 protein n=1 Tax=Flavobacterium daemonense TaxID=1393049 RepID=UPI001185BBD0|nr:beta-galactosidase [Flavobacterium daemonense]KAF2329073.1 beta-galactosidase [Flavobacterium daemonense]
MKRLITITSLFCLFFLFEQNLTAQNTFIAGKNQFELNGKPFLIRAAELHYPRIPKEYWEHRIQMCKAMGMNTICIYTFWNLHEQKEGVYDFSGQNDVAEFVRLIKKNGMYCIVRPGPYVCAEWDMGGLPWWLLKKEDIEVRTLKDPFFMKSATAYLNRVGKELSSLQIQNGGNIIMVQVENEYGVWGNDGDYMTKIRDIIRASGFDKVQLFRCDWSSNFDRYKVPGVAETLNFGAGSNIENQFKKFKTLNPDAPLMCSEYWTGWFDQWGRPHETRGVETFLGSLKDMMDNKISFSLYMAHGGTSFGQWSGANAPPYAPTVSSYDYDAPINEAGQPTEKFYAIRSLLQNYLNEGETIPPLPSEPSKFISLPEIAFTKKALLRDNLKNPKTTDVPKTMEYFDQGWGRILYRNKISADDSERILKIDDVHDYAVVYLNDKYLGKLDRRFNETSLKIPATKKDAQLDILVETTGRVNYGKAIIDRKGINGKVYLSKGAETKELHNWQIYNFPVDAAFQKDLKYGNLTGDGPAWYKSSFKLSETGDVYLDMRGWGKGMVWVNGHNLGRFWKIGPTQSMYLPGKWLNVGENEIIVFDVENHDKPVIKSVGTPVFEIIADASMLHRKEGEMLDLSDAVPVTSGSFTSETGWKEVKFKAVVKGRYFCLEALSSQLTSDNSTSIAELEILGEDGKAISALKWKVVFADSEEVTASGSSADKIFDLQESVIWQTRIGDKKAAFPHTVVIDMGENNTVSGFRILPRTDKSKNGIIKDYRFYLQEKKFNIKL